MISFKDWLSESAFVVNDEWESCINRIISDASFPQSVRMRVMLDYMDKNYSQTEIRMFKDLYKKEFIPYSTSDHQSL